MHNIIASHDILGLESIFVLANPTVFFKPQKAQRTVVHFLADSLQIALQTQKSFQPTYLSGLKM